MNLVIGLIGIAAVIAVIDGLIVIAVAGGTSLLILVNKNELELFVIVWLLLE